MPALRRLAPPLLAFALLPAGCGSERTVPVRNRTLGLKLDEYRIRPGRLTAPAGRLRIIVRNRGALTHNVAVERVPDDPEAQPEVLGRTDTVHPGQRAVAYVTLARGEYRLACTIGNHDDLGQTATLTVR